MLLKLSEHFLEVKKVSQLIPFPITKVFVAGQPNSAWYRVISFKTANLSPTSILNTLVVVRPKVG